MAEEIYSLRMSFNNLVNALIDVIARSMRQD